MANADQTGRVKDQNYYHINRLVDWSPHGFMGVENVKDVGGSSNPFFRLFETVRAAYPVTQSDGSVAQVPAVRFLGQVSSGDITTQMTVQELAGKAHDVAKHFMMYVRELIWEDIRRREFPHLPSRQRCVWLIPNQDGVRYWLQRMEVKQDFQVLRVRVQGRLHTASESYLLGDSEPMEETIKKARQYWLGIVEEAETEEIIFEGRVRVEEVMPPDFYT